MWRIMRVYKRQGGRRLIADCWDARQQIGCEISYPIEKREFVESLKVGAFVDMSDLLFPDMKGDKDDRKADSN